MGGTRSIHWGHNKCAHLFEELEGKNPQVLEKIILKCMLNIVWGSGLDSAGSGCDPVTGCSEDANEIWIDRGWEFLDQLNDSAKIMCRWVCNADLVSLVFNITKTGRSGFLRKYSWYVVWCWRAHSCVIKHFKTNFRLSGKWREQ
jgi:hypothetical protein